METQKNFQTIWEYHVMDEHIAQFKQIYAADGDWVKLFSKFPGFLKTELIQDCDHNNRFITIDYWMSRGDFLNMRGKIGPEYQELDIRTEKFMLSENHLGYFEGT